MAYRYLPFIMGALMGLMMLGMVHMMLSGGSDIAGWALIGFVAAHFLLAGAVIAASVFAARLSPAVQRFLDRLHRPSGRHVLRMVAGAAGTVLITHLVVHGGL